jgi:NADH dehydrogenase
MSQENPEILILGGGYAGVSAAVHLKPLAASGAARVTLVNKYSSHYLTTILHHSAVWQPGYEAASVYLPELLGPQIGFLRGEVQAIDPDRKRVEVRTREGLKTLCYDVLVIALGWEPHFYSIPGLQEHALVLRDLSSAHLIHSRIQMAMAAYDANPNDHWCTHIVIGGGGFTGVELAGEIADWRPRLAKTFDLNPDDIQITVVEGAPTILSGFEPLLVEQATRILERKGVRLITGARIGCVESHRVVLGDGRELQAGVILWAGGVRGHRLVEGGGFAVNAQGRAFVSDYLQARDYPEVYVVGDSALALDDRGHPLPPTAQIAVQEGHHAATNITRALQNRVSLPFQPKRLGTFLSVGCQDALGVLNFTRYFQLRFYGWVARTLKNLIARRYLWSIGGPGLALGGRGRG